MTSSTELAVADSQETRFAFGKNWAKFLSHLEEGQAEAFYAIDPGPAGRSGWSERLGRKRWVVITYDTERRTGRTEAASF